MPLNSSGTLETTSAYEPMQASLDLVLMFDRSFGDSKFIPRVPAEKVEALAKASPQAEKLWPRIKDDLYESTSIGKMHLGYPDKGHISTYYPDSPGITHEEIEYVSDFVKNKGLMPENTRLRKTPAGDYELLIASAITEPAQRDLKESQWALEGPLKDRKLTLVYGDHGVEMGKIARNLMEAKKHALNDEEDQMQGDYIRAFHDGSMRAHVDSQRHWIKVRQYSISIVKPAKVKLGQRSNGRVQHWLHRDVSRPSWHSGE